MRQIPKAEWYLDKCTWCGVTKEGERYYPVSWDNDSTAYGMTKILSRCLDFHNAQQARKMLEAELKEDAFFTTRYERIEFVELKVYPNEYFGFCEAAKKHKIAKVTRHSMQTEEIKAILAEYGLEEVSGDELVIVSRRDNGEFFEQILADKSKNKSKIEKMCLEKSVYRGSTYLMKSVKDMELLIRNVRGAKHIGYLYDEEHKCFPTFTDDIYFPCLAVIYDDEASVHSIAEAREYIANANAMLDELENALQKKGAAV